MTTKTCVFCGIAAGTEPATVVREWPDAIAFLPHGGVGERGDHVLVIPRCHVDTAIEDATVTAAVTARAVELVRGLGWGELNFIDNIGEAASQTVFHYHRHAVRRRPGDGLALPWTHQEESA